VQDLRQCGQSPSNKLSPTAASTGEWEDDPKQQALFEFSIYTIAHPDKLAKAASRRVAAKFSEAKVWKTGYDLWIKA
jgi:hypothetical protein